MKLESQQMGAPPNRERISSAEMVAIIFYFENADCINLIWDIWQTLGPYARQMLEQMKPGITARVEEAVKR